MKCISLDWGPRCAAALPVFLCFLCAAQCCAADLLMVGFSLLFFQRLKDPLAGRQVGKSSVPSAAKNGTALTYSLSFSLPFLKPPTTTTTWVSRSAYDSLSLVRYRKRLNNGEGCTLDISAPLLCFHICFAVFWPLVHTTLETWSAANTALILPTLL